MNTVEMCGITKRFGSFMALENVDFTVKEGEIHSLLGENGAGKSTLMNILYGLLQPDKGIIKIKSKMAILKHPSEAIKHGIGMVHQHFMLTPVMSVAENIIVGAEPVKSFLINYKKAVSDVQNLIDKYHFRINANAKVQTLSVGEQQRVEILKALFRGADILILDEPTAVLTPQEVKELFLVLKELKKNGKSIILITHKLRETLEIADCVSVLRAGSMVNMRIDRKKCSMNELAFMMVGRTIDFNSTHRRDNAEKVAYEVRNLNLSVKGIRILKNVSLKVCKGQIYGIAGIEGNGQTELIEVLTGLRKPDSMELLKDGRRIHGDAKDFIKHGIGHIPEDRATRGLLLPMTIEDNLILGYHKLKKFSEKGVRKEKNISKFAENILKEYDIKAIDSKSLCQSLSGGNQQKVVIARVFSEEPEVLIVAQPTRGVDVGAQEFIHNRLLDLRDEGKAILLISADLDEVRRLSDRLSVIYNGEIVAESSYDTWGETELGLLMTGSRIGEEI